VSPREEAEEKRRERQAAVAEAAAERQRQRPRRDGEDGVQGFMERQADRQAERQRQRREQGDGEDDVLNELELKFWEEVEPDLANPAHACR
jgi:hypothetical protein